MRTDRLVAMANQIAASVPVRSRAAEQTAAHLRAFWAPAMISDLADRARTQPGDVRPEVHAALADLLPEEAHLG